MNFRQTTILGLFDSSQKRFIIPVYQRAYSWTEDNWETFFSDLLEQSCGDNKYFYGNILLESIQPEIEYEVIDGQQRLTTLVIFIRTIIDSLKSRNYNLEVIEKLTRIYLIDNGNTKLRPVEYDRNCFNELIIEGKVSYSAINSPSQKKIFLAKQYFLKKLNDLSSETIVKLLNKLEFASLTYIDISGKKEASLMFELQNNRGKELTNMEKLKSFFMYQMYVHSSKEETDSNVEYVSDVFEQIYLKIIDIKMPEDSILIYHCNAYINGYNYRTISDIKQAYTQSAEKIKWIKEFISNLRNSFDYIKKMESSKLSYLDDLRSLEIPAFVYPFIIKGYHYLGEDDVNLNKLFHILEQITFRYKLISSRAYFESRINEILLNFLGDIEKLKQDFKNKFNKGDSSYWSDERLKEVLGGYMYENPTLHYILWKYESHIQNKGYKIGICSLENEQIEHISPKTPPDPNELLASGYDVNTDNNYSDEFIEKRLNSIGNLMLISGSHNASIGNRPFEEKLRSYRENPLLRQQAEIPSFLSDKNKIEWKSEEIENRQRKIIDFAISKWC